MNIKNIKQSQTIEIKRSQIKFNPKNPKRHSPDNIKRQKKNIKKIGFLGGIVWNEFTGHLIDGHRRICALDEYVGYNGNSETDYEIKVERVCLSEREELEQTTYMTVGNSAYENDLIAEYINDIDYSDLGFSDNELNDILNFASKEEISVESFDEFLYTPPKGKLLYPTQNTNSDFSDTTNPYSASPSNYNEGEGETQEDEIFVSQQKEAKEAVKQAKNKISNGVKKQGMDENAYITLSFSTFDAKEDFCDMVGVSTDAQFLKGEELLNRLGIS